MNDLITDVQLATEFGITLDRLHRLRREKQWPCVKLGRTDFRFTPEQREQIIAMQSVAGGSRGAAGQGSGLTRGSRARGSR